MAIIIGGILPALLIGFALVMVKLSGQQGISPGSSMVFTAIGVFISGLIASIFGLSGGVSINSSISSILVGIFWGAGTLLMSLAVNKMGLPMGISASLAAANILVVLLISIIFFKEGASMDLIKVFVGASFVIVGSIFISLA